MGAILAAAPAIFQAGKGIYNAVKGKGSVTDAVGQAIGTGAELYGGYKAQQAQGQNDAARQAQYNNVTGQAQGMMTGNGPTEYEKMMNGFLQSQAQPQNYAAQQVGAQQIDPSQLGIPSMGQSKSFNAGQDALMQMLNRSPAQQLGSAGNYLDDLAANGGKQDLTALLGAMGQQQNANLQDQVAQQTARVSGLGQLSGTANSIGAARLRNRAMIDNNTLNAQVQTQEMNNVNNRRLAAAGQLGSLNLQGVQNQMSAAGQLGQFANMESQAGMQGAQMRLGAMQSNQGAALQAGQLNQSAGLSANSQNNQATQAFQQMMQQGLVSGANMGATNRAQNAGLLGLIAGQQAPQVSTQSPFAQSIQNTTFMPALYGALQRKPNQYSSIPTNPQYQVR